MPLAILLFSPAVPLRRRIAPCAALLGLALTGACGAQTPGDLPLLAFIESDGCGDIRVFAVNADGSEALIVNADVETLGLERERERSFDLADPPAGLQVFLDVYRRPPPMPQYCTDILVEVEPPAKWSSVGGRVTIELRDSNEWGDGFYSAVVVLKNAIFEDGAGFRVEQREPIELTATVGWLPG